MKKCLSLLLAISLVLSFTVFFTSCSDNTDDPEQTTVEETTVDTYIADPTLNPLTGEKDYTAASGVRTVSIIVENSPASRPQWGLTSPDILIEYEVEGGITRMLWLYADVTRIPEKVGPVRSARHDIVELALGFDSIFVHWGRSSFALDTITKYADVLSNVDGLTYTECFYRDTERDVASEHTGYTVGSALRSSIASLGISTSHSEGYTNPFRFAKETRVLSGTACSSLDIAFSSAYKYTFNYNSSTNKYDTLINGTARVDENGTQCSYSNVIILYTDTVDMGTSSGHQDLVLENGGTGIYVNGGNSEEIKWTKTGETDPVILYKADGSRLELNAGNSYIGFVRSTQAGKTVIA